MAEPAAACPHEKETKEEEKEEEEEEEEEGAYMEYFSNLIKEAEKPKEDAPFHFGDLPPEDNQFGSYYIPRVIGPEDEPLPDMPWDNTGPNEEAKKMIVTLLKLLRKSGIMAIFFERLPKNLALAGYYNKIYDLKSTSPWTMLEDVSHLVEGDVIEMAAHDWTLLVRTKAWCNFYENPLAREKYWRMKKEEEEKAEALLSKRTNIKRRIMRLELLSARILKAEQLFEQQRQAITLLLMFQNKYKYNSEMHEYLRENVAHHERDIIALKTDVKALKSLYGKILQQP
jgi:hypothetical protein